MDVLVAYSVLCLQIRIRLLTMPAQYVEQGL